MADTRLALVQAQDALRHGRQTLETLCTELLGAFVSPPKGSKLDVTIQELRDAETTVQAALIADLKPQKK